MTAKELRKSLANGLRLDSSGKTNPVQRLAPFLDDLVTYLEEHELPIAYRENDIIPGHESEWPHGPVSSDTAPQAVPKENE